MPAKTERSLQKLLENRRIKLDNTILYEKKPYEKTLAETEYILRNPFLIKEFRNKLDRKKGPPVKWRKELAKRARYVYIRMKRDTSNILLNKEHYKTLDQKARQIKDSYQYDSFLKTTIQSIKSKTYCSIVKLIDKKVSKRREHLINKVINLPNILATGITKYDIMITESNSPNLEKLIKQSNSISEMQKPEFTESFLETIKKLGEKNLTEILKFQSGTIYIQQIKDGVYNHELFLESQVIYNAMQEFELSKIKPLNFVPKKLKGTSLAVQTFFNKNFHKTPIKKMYISFVHATRRFSYGDNYLENWTNADFPEESGEFLKKYRLMFPETFNYWLQKIEKPTSIPAVA